MDAPQEPEPSADGPTPVNPSDRARLEALFERYEALPSLDDFASKASLVERILTEIARHTASEETRPHPGRGEAAQRKLGSEVSFEGHRAIEELAARLRMMSPEVPDHDDTVLELIDAVRADLERETTDAGRAALPGSEAAADVGDVEDDMVDEASRLSFPASDPPAY